jgi:hypothetical protein
LVAWAFRKIHAGSLAGEDRRSEITPSAGDAGGEIRMTTSGGLEFSIGESTFLPIAWQRAQAKTDAVAPFGFHCAAGWRGCCAVGGVLAKFHASGEQSDHSATRGALFLNTLRSTGCRWCAAMKAAAPRHPEAAHADKDSLRRANFFRR